MGKISQKKNLSSMQVLKTLQLLLQGDYSMGELVQRLNADEQGGVFNNSVISKYINTCRYIGIKIPKIQGKYYVANLPFGFQFDEHDMNAIKTLQFVIKNNFTNKSLAIFNNLVSKLSRFSRREITTVEKENYIFSYELFERAIAKKVKMKLLFKNRAELECIPMQITHEGNKTYFVVYKNRVRTIDTQRLAGIELLGEKFVDPFDGNQVTIYKLRGDLAKRYQAREHESIEKNPDGTITVTNRNEHKDILLLSLPYYFTYLLYCEI